MTLPFEDELGDSAVDEGGDGSQSTYSVAELNGSIAEAIVGALPRQVWVRGEIAQLRVSGNGHAYFDLCEKDARRDHVRAKLSVALFRNDRATVNRTLRDAGVKLGEGVEVRIRGRVDFYAPQGRVQLIMNAIDPVFTIGKIAAERARVLQVLAKEGLLERQRALSLPMVPLRIGLVTSRDSAAYHDFVQELHASGHAFRVFPVDVRVQGQGADRRIMYGLRTLSTMELDAIVIARGGGARSDLAAFDSERLARLVAGLAVPVIAGVGHEIDRTVADEVAHLSVKTPTAAAALFVEAVDAYCEQLARIAHRVSIRARSACTLAGRDTTDLGRRLARAAPVALQRERRLVDAHRRHIGEHARRGVRDAATRVQLHGRTLVAGARRTVRDSGTRADLATARLRLLDPRRVLERGYSITRRGDGRLVRSPDDVERDGVLLTETAGGSVRSRVVSDDEPGR